MEIEVKDEATDNEIILKIIPVVNSNVVQEANKIVDVFYNNISGELYHTILSIMINRELKDISGIEVKVK